MARPVLKPRTDREVFDLPLQIRPEHIDDNGHVNNVIYVGWLQDAGTAHWNARFDAETRAKLEKIAHTCPVAISLHPDVVQAVQLRWAEVETV